MNDNDSIAYKGKMIAIDTSTSSMTVAVTEGLQLLGSKSSFAERNHSRYLVPSMQELLQSLRLSPQQLEAVAVGAGPGSYTGVRIGISVAKTVAWSLNIPIYTVSSLEAMALGGREKYINGTATSSGEWIIPLVDARRGQVFTGLYAGRGACASGLDCLIADGIRLMEQWVEELHRYASTCDQVPSRILFVGEADKFAEEARKLEVALQGKIDGIDVFNHQIDAFDVARLAYPLWHAGKNSDVHHIVPNYTQLPEAEVKLQSRLAEN